MLNKFNRPKFGAEFCVLGQARDGRAQTRAQMGRRIHGDATTSCSPRREMWHEPQLWGPLNPPMASTKRRRPGRDARPLRNWHASWSALVVAFGGEMIKRSIAGMAGSALFVAQADCRLLLLHGEKTMHPPRCAPNVSIRKLVREFGLRLVRRCAL